MIERLSNAIRAHSASLDLSSSQCKLAVVASVDPSTSMARVLLQPEGVLSGWLPVLTSWVGNGWGMVCLPQAGDQVFIAPQDGDIEQGVVMGGCYSRQQKPPAAPPGEFWLVHKSGSYIKLAADGAIHVGGDLHVDGRIFDKIGSLSHLRESFNAHVHSTPSGLSNTPSPTDEPNV